MLFKKNEWKLFLFLVLQMPDYEGKDDLVWRLQQHLKSMYPLDSYEIKGTYFYSSKRTG